MEGQTLKSIIAALLLGGFGIFLIWKGITGDIIKLSSGQSFIPRWMYVLGGIVVLILPVSYLLILLLV